MKFLTISILIAIMIFSGLHDCQKISPRKEKFDAIMKQRASSLSLTGYECTHPAVNLKTIDLTSVGPCMQDQATLPPTDQNIQLLELIRNEIVEVYSCRIEVLGHIFNCGAFSHLSFTKDSIVNYFYHLDDTSCRKLVKTGSLRLLERDFIGLQEGKINIRKMDIGRSGEKDCFDNMEFTLNGQTYNDAVAGLTMKIEFSRYNATKKEDADLIILPNGDTCYYTSTTCLLSSYGQLFWNIYPTNTCVQSKVSLLYQGLSKRINDLRNHNSSTYIVETVTQVFALKVTQEIQLCGYLGWATEHPDLIIIESDNKGRGFIPSLSAQKYLTGNIITYLNTKIVYIERSITQNIEDIYNDLLQKQCEADRKILINYIHDAYINPNGFAKFITKREGSMGIITGEVIHVLSCVPIPVQIRLTNRCYQEIPINYGSNHTGFLSPSNRLITDIGTEISCSDLIPSMFKVNNAWYRIDQTINQLPPPETLLPVISHTWKPRKTQNTLTAGLYTKETLEKTLDVIYYGRNKDSMIYTAARSGYDQNADTQNYDVVNGITPNQMKGLFAKYFESLTSFTDYLGHYTSIGIGLWVIISIVIWIINSILRALSIKKLGGNKLHIWAAVQSGLTQYVTATRIKPQDNIELSSIDIHPSPGSSHIVDSESDKGISLYPSLNQNKHISHVRKH